MQFNTQPILENRRFILLPLEESDFAALYAVASDPQVWEQHPNHDRWKEEVFRGFFKEALKSNGTFKIVDKNTTEVIGSTRFYDYDRERDSIFVGYTFYATKCWGKGINRSVKELMFDYAFQFITIIRLSVGMNNIRSQIAVTRLGAEKAEESTMSAPGETPRINFVYEINKDTWNNSRVKL